MNFDDTENEIQADFDLNKFKEIKDE